MSTTYSETTATSRLDPGMCIVYAHASLCSELKFSRQSTVEHLRFAFELLTVVWTRLTHRLRLVMGDYQTARLLKSRSLVWDLDEFYTDISAKNCARTRGYLGYQSWYNRKSITHISIFYNIQFALYLSPNTCSCTPRDLMNQYNTLRVHCTAFSKDASASNQNKLTRNMYKYLYIPLNGSNAKLISKTRLASICQLFIEQELSTSAWVHAGDLHVKGNSI